MCTCVRVLCTCVVAALVASNRHRRQFKCCARHLAESDACFCSLRAQYLSVWVNCAKTRESVGVVLYLSRGGRLSVIEVVYNGIIANISLIRTSMPTLLIVPLMCVGIRVSVDCQHRIRYPERRQICFRFEGDMCVMHQSWCICWYIKKHTHFAHSYS